MSAAAILASAALLGGVPHDSTAYCLTGTMADGTKTRPRSLAHNGYRLGTRVRVSPAVFGLRNWVVRDRIGHGTSADFWTGSCAQARKFGRRTIRITVR